jgi:tetratricopeptide (TPR) repeat protein
MTGYHMKKILYILLLLVLPLVATAQEENHGTVENTAADKYTKALGDSAYSKGEYSNAIDIYEATIAESGSSLQLYYNLGNAYFRNNMLGHAILNYERALHIDPTDEDTKANLELAQSRMKDELTEQYEIFLVSWFRSLTAMFSLSAWAVVGVVAFLILLISVLLVLFNKNTALRKIFIAIAVVSLIATIFANISAYSLYSYMNDKSNAIIMKEEVSLKSTPNNSGTVLIKVHEGRKVRIADDTMTDWKKIELEDGTVGWVPFSVIERI